MSQNAASPPRLIPILATVTGCGIVASVIYAPSVPAMIEAFGVSRDDVQASFTVYLATFGLGQLLIGPLVDRYGRRTVLLIGLAIMALASIACVFVRSIELLWALRVVQALGGCAGSVVPRAIVRDVYSGPQLSRAVSAMSASIALAPALSPMIGGLLQSWFGWQANFLAVAVIAGVAWIGVWVAVPETRRHAALATSVLRQLFLSYRAVLGDRSFLMLTMVIAAGSSLFYSFTAAGPILLIAHHGLPPSTYGWFAGFPALGFMTGSLITNRLVERVGHLRLMIVGSGGLLVITLTGAVLAGTDLPVIPLVFAIMTCIGLGNGLSFPNASVIAIGRHPRIAGAASAMTGFLQMGGAASGTLAVLLIAHDTARQLFIVQAVAAAVMVAMVLLVRGDVARDDESNGSGDR